MKLLLLGIIVGIFSQSSLGDTTVATDYEFLVAQKDYGSVLDSVENGVSGSVKAKVDDQFVSAPYKTRIRGIEVNLDYKLIVETDLRTSHGYPFRLEVTSARVQIGSIITRDQIWKKISGVNVRLNVEGSCFDTSMELQRPKTQGTGIVSLFQSGDTLNGKIRDFTLDSLKNGWGISSIFCTGPVGYQSGIAEKILAVFGQQAELEQMIVRKMEKEMAVQLALIEDRILQERNFQLSSNLNVNMVPSNFKLSNNGSLIIGGKIYFDISTIQVRNVIELVNFKVRPGSYDGQKSVLVLPDQLLDVLVKELYRANLLSHTMNGRDYKSFRKIMKSRFTQFFVFPALWRYSKRSNFRFNMMSGSEPELSFRWMEGNSLKTLVQGMVYYDMLAPERNTYIPFVRFYSETSMLFSFSIPEKGKLNLRFLDPSMNLKYLWDRSYLKRHPWTRRRISRRSINRHAKKAIDGSQFNFNLGHIDLSSHVRLWPRQLGASVDFLEIYFDQK